MSLGLLVGLTLPATPLAENPIGRNSALRNGSRGGLATLRRNDNTAQLALQGDAGRRRHADRKRSYRPIATTPDDLAEKPYETDFGLDDAPASGSALWLWP